VTKEFYLMRHGVTEKPGVLLGQYDATLSAEGRRQARDAAQQLAHERIERVVSSTLLRARETAQFVAERFGIGPEADGALNEISYGRWDGLRWNQIEQLDPLTARQKAEDWWSATPVGGERSAEFAQRVAQAWQSLLAQPARATVVVAHEAVNAVLTDLARQQDGGDNRVWQPDWTRISGFKQEPGAYCKVTVDAL
jgi:2,3-bisphosphoglycerate-dependent phosphoglycerate mutase